MLPTRWMPTGSSVLFVNFDRAPGPLHPTAIMPETKCRSFRRGDTTGSRLGSGSPVVCHTLDCKSRSQRQKHNRRNQKKRGQQKEVGLRRRMSPLVVFPRLNDPSTGLRVLKRRVVRVMLWVVFGRCWL